MKNENQLKKEFPEFREFILNHFSGVFFELENGQLSEEEVYDSCKKEIEEMLHIGNDIDIQQTEDVDDYVSSVLEGISYEDL